MRALPSQDEEARHSAHLRRLNLERVLAVGMESAGPFTRAELIHRTGLSAPTVGRLASHLIRSGVLNDLGTAPSRGGRRPSLMEFNSRHGFAAAIDLGPTHTRLAVGDLRGERIAYRVMPTPPAPEPEELLLTLAAALDALLEEAHVPRERLLVVGAGAPGAVDRARGTVVALAPNLTGWSQVPMASILERALGTRVVLENDVNLAVLGERWRGAARGHDSCVFITVGTGIGAGIILNGELHHGHHFLAGEIALMCMGPQYVNTDFGARGCLESLAGLKALAARWTHLHGGRSDEPATALFDAAELGDPQARGTVSEAATLIGIATANLSLVLDPSLIVVGGAFFAHRPEVVEEVRQVVARIIPTPIPVVPSALGEEAPLWGGLLMATTEARERLRQQLRDASLAS